MIERENGLSNDALRKFAKNHGIKTMTRQESLLSMSKYIDYPKGDSHWRRNNKEASAKLSKIHSDRLKVDNPSNNPESKRKITASLAKTLKKSPTFHEQLMIDFFNSHGIPFEHQFVVGEYIADFRVGPILIELDGRGHASRSASDAVRDKTLTDIGWGVVRINQDSLFDKRAKNPKFRPYRLMYMVKYLIKWHFMLTGFWHFSNCLVPDGGKYRVIVRKPNGISVTV